MKPPIPNLIILSHIKQDRWVTPLDKFIQQTVSFLKQPSRSYTEITKVPTEIKNPYVSEPAGIYLAKISSLSGSGSGAVQWSMSSNGSILISGLGVSTSGSFTARLALDPPQ